MEQASLVQRLKSKLRGDQPFRSANYWDARYQSGGSSGPGSYGRLAEFKSEVINRLIAEHGVHSVVELGCGDGNQLVQIEVDRFVGLDVSSTALELAAARVGDRAGVELALYEPSEFAAKVAGFRAEMALSLDVIYHLVEDAVFETYMRDLFSLAERLVVVYASNFDDQTSKHVRHRRFTAWIEANQPGARLIEEIPNRFPFDPADPDQTSHADFFVYDVSPS